MPGGTLSSLGQTSSACLCGAGGCRFQGPSATSCASARWPYRRRRGGRFDVRHRTLLQQIPGEAAEMAGGHGGAVRKVSRLANSLKRNNLVRTPSRSGAEILEPESAEDRACGG